MSNIAIDITPVRNMLGKMLCRDIKYSPGQYVEAYRIIKVIGEGRYGICYLVTDDKEFFVMKQLKRKTYLKNPLKAQYEEEILKVLKHEAIPKFIKKTENEHVLMYLLEHKQGVTLESMAFDKKHIFSGNEIYQIGKQLIDVLVYLHGSGVVHRDIRLPNVLYNDKCIYLVDFGLARWMNDQQYKANIDFSYLGDLLIHLYYTSHTGNSKKDKPWYKELVLERKELLFLKKLMGVEKRYEKIQDVKADFEEMMQTTNRTGQQHND